jgi:hypothetical protein
MIGAIRSRASVLGEVRFVVVFGTEASNPELRTQLSGRGSATGADRRSVRA